MRMHGIWSVIGLDYIPLLAAASMLLFSLEFSFLVNSPAKCCMTHAHRHRIKEGCITGTLIEIKIALSSSFPLFAQSIYFSHTFTCVTLSLPSACP